MEGGYPWVPKGITRKNLRVWVGLGLCLYSMGIFGLGTQRGLLFWVVLGIKPVGKILAIVGGEKRAKILPVFWLSLVFFSSKRFQIYRNLQIWLPMEYNFQAFTGGYEYRSYSEWQLWLSHLVLTYQFIFCFITNVLIILDFYFAVAVEKRAKIHPVS